MIGAQRSASAALNFLRMPIEAIPMSEHANPSIGNINGRLISQLLTSAGARRGSVASAMSLSPNNVAAMAMVAMIEPT